MRELWKRLLFPTKCPFCGKVLFRERCQCVPQSDSSPCVKGTVFGRCAVCFRYEGEVRQAILRFKFGGDRSGIPVFTDHLVRTVTQELAGEFDVVTWVPISAQRRKKRGYDQAYLLAESLAKQLKLPLLSTLEKQWDNPPQSKLVGWAERQGNVCGIYRASQSEQTAGKRLLLVDDILTTGATLGECVRTLQQVGAEQVVCCVLAQAIPKTEKER